MESPGDYKSFETPRPPYKGNAQVPLKEMCSLGKVNSDQENAEWSNAISKYGSLTKEVKSSVSSVLEHYEAAEHVSDKWVRKGTIIGPDEERKSQRVKSLYMASPPIHRSHMRLAVSPHKRNGADLIHPSMMVSREASMKEQHALSPKTPIFSQSNSLKRSSPFSGTSANERDKLCMRNTSFRIEDKPPLRTKNNSFTLAKPKRSTKFWDGSDVAVEVSPIKVFSLENSKSGGNGKMRHVERIGLYDGLSPQEGKASKVKEDNMVDGLGHQENQASKMRRDNVVGKLWQTPHTSLQDGHVTKVRGDKVVGKVWQTPRVMHDGNGHEDDLREEGSMKQADFRKSVLDLRALFNDKKKELVGGQRGLQARRIILDCYREYLVNGCESLQGVIPGVEIGDKFSSHVELDLVGVHRQLIKGIDVIPQHKSKWMVHGQFVCVATSIVVTSDYVDNRDEGDVIIYTGEGGNNYALGTGQAKDQTLHGGNAALRHSMMLKLSIRVIRKVEISSVKSVYRYDGLYEIVDMKKAKSRGYPKKHDGDQDLSRMPLVYMFAMVCKAANLQGEFKDVDVWTFKKDERKSNTLRTMERGQWKGKAPLNSR